MRSRYHSEFYAGKHTTKSMKLKTLALLLALGTVPAFAIAQTPPPPAVNPGGPMQTPAPQFRQMMQAHMAAMRGFQQAMEREQRATRARMLAALSAAHRLAVAHIVGTLAISSNPDPRAAAREIDAILSSQERAAVLAAGRAQMQAMHAQMEAMRAQMQAQMAQMHAQMGQMHGHMMMQWHQREMGEHGHRAPDAGRMLLRSLLPGHEGPRMLFMMHGAPPHQP